MSTFNRSLMRKLRTQFQMNQSDLSYLSGISLATIAKLESGELSNPRLSTMNAIAKAFNISTAQLLSEEHPEPANSGE